MKRTIGVLLITLLCTSTAWGNSIASSTMVFQGTLTVEADGYSGTIAMTAGEYYTPGGDGEAISTTGGFDVYAEDGGTAYVEGMSPETWLIGSDHDAYSESGPWGFWYDPDCADWDKYRLVLTETTWELWYQTDRAPMSGPIDWATGYAIETDKNWYAEWGWGTENIPLQLPGFSVTVEDLGSSTYRVTLTPAAPSEVWVDDDFNSSTPGWGVTHFDNIQDGIDAVSGSIVYVAAGTYSPTAQLLIDEDLTLIGAGKDVTILTPDFDTGTGSYGLDAAFIRIATGASVTIEDLAIDGTGHTVRHAIQARGDDLIVRRCDISNISAGTYAGRGIVILTGTGLVEDCTMSNIRRIGVHVRGSIEPTPPTVTVTGLTYVGKGDGDFLDYGVEFGGGGKGSVEGSTIMDCRGVASVDGSTSGAILATDYYGTFTEASVLSCVLQNNTTGIIVGYGTSDVTVLSAHYNQIMGNTTGISAVSAQAVDARFNWWGDASGPLDTAGTTEVPTCTGDWTQDLNADGTGDSVTDKVLYCPWWDAPERLTLEPDFACYEDGATVNVSLWMRDITEDIVGGQFFLTYDTNRLAFDSASPAGPFGDGIGLLTHDPVAGTLHYTVDIAPMPGGGDSTTGSQHMATLTFTAQTQICHEDDLITWRSHQPPSRLSTDIAEPVYPTLMPMDVHDDVAPTFTICPSDLTVQCDGTGNTAALNAWLASAAATDNCGTIIITHDFSSLSDDCGATGSASVTWTAKDSCGNTATCAATFTIEDTTPPTLVCQGDLGPISNDTGLCGAEVSFSSTADDVCGTAAVVHRIESVPGTSGYDTIITSPYVFPVGTTTVQATATDDCGLTSVCTFTVLIVDDENPTITCPVDIDQTADAGLCEAYINVPAPVTDDNCDVASVVNDYTGTADASGTYPVGQTTVTWTVTDIYGNFETCDQIITITDDEDPVIEDCPADISVPADAGVCTAVVSWTEPTASDNCGIQSFTSDWAPGDTFPSGITTVTYTATDVHNNESTCSFTVTVANENELVLDITLSPAIETGALTRCITFELWECPGTTPAAIVPEEITFTDGSATGVTVMVPCGNYTCITARDELHTLRSTSAMVIPTGETYYTADFTGDHELIGGNMNDDEWIDILDFGVYSWQFAENYATGDTRCSTLYPHADINGDGIVSTGDFTFIQTNFLMGHEANCCGAPGLRLGGQDEFNGPVTEISLTELRARGLEHLSVADLNADGQLDQADVAAFLMGARPEPKPNKPSINPAAKRRADLRSDRIQ